MEEKNETPEVEETKEESTDVEETKEETTDWEAKAKELEGINRRLKTKLDKSKEKPKTEKSKKTKETNEEFGLLEKSYLRSADIVNEDEVELVKKLMDETGKSVDNLIDTKYFKSELEDLRTTKANEKATSGVKGGRGSSKATDTPEHWIAKGVPPTKEQVPDRKTRVKIARAMMANASTGGKKFYND